ncbi:hypothetical protein OC846_001275 [Tilletia horrida]|uniref:HIT domain-containing protein n=1 Tax=Tilletia horrida TaxID=155126 RepID=A0AAN6JT66_9BASI|nr:hypothetical protein OC845_000750 [Tilletia horrida]KAK0556320.1 hypothetical protein OC846_001275 [Tilletia horrida]
MSTQTGGCKAASYQSATSSSTAVRFANFDVTSQTFYTSTYANAIVNLKPLVPGHVLVIPPRPTAKRFLDLSAEEVGGLFQGVRDVSRAIEKAYGAEALTISVQDGLLAGQTVPHVHVHILPRHQKDFEPNDSLYPLLQKFGFQLEEIQRAYAAGSDGVAPDDAERKPRSDEEMHNEAEWLRGQF